MTDASPRPGLDPGRWAYLKISEGCSHRCALLRHPPHQGALSLAERRLRSSPKPAPLAGRGRQGDRPHLPGHDLFRPGPGAPGRAGRASRAACPGPRRRLDPLPLRLSRGDHRTPPRGHGRRRRSAATSTSPSSTPIPAIVKRMKTGPGRRPGPHAPRQDPDEAPGRRRPDLAHRRLPRRRREGIRGAACSSSGRPGSTISASSPIRRSPGRRPAALEDRLSSEEKERRRGRDHGTPGRDLPGQKPELVGRTDRRPRRRPRPRGAGFADRAAAVPGPGGRRRRPRRRRPGRAREPPAAIVRGRDHESADTTILTGRLRPMKTVSRILATFFGSGFCPDRPGHGRQLRRGAALSCSSSSGLSWPVLGRAHRRSSSWPGSRRPRRYSAELGRNDPGRIVIDEVCGQLVALLPVRPDLGPRGRRLSSSSGFSISSNPSRSGSWRGFPRGWGIMADDVGAGLAAAAVLRLALCSSSETGELGFEGGDHRRRHGAADAVLPGHRIPSS